MSQSQPFVGRRIALGKTFVSDKAIKSAHFQDTLGTGKCPKLLRDSGTSGKRGHVRCGLICAHYRYEQQRAKAFGRAPQPICQGRVIATKPSSAELLTITTYDPHSTNCRPLVLGDEFTPKMEKEVKEARKAGIVPPHPDIIPRLRPAHPLNLPGHGTSSEAPLQLLSDPQPQDAALAGVNAPSAYSSPSTAGPVRIDLRIARPCCTFRDGNHHRLNPSIIADIIGDDIRGRTSFDPNHVRSLAANKLSIPENEVPYHMAFKALKLIEESWHGSLHHQYGTAVSRFQNIIRQDKDSVVYIKFYPDEVPLNLLYSSNHPAAKLINQKPCNDKSKMPTVFCLRLQAVAVIPGTAVRRINNVEIGQRRIARVGDATFLKGTSRGTLTHEADFLPDGEPLITGASADAENESKNSLHFLQEVSSNNVGHPFYMCLDRMKGNHKVTYHNYPNCHQGHCCYHASQNLKKPSNGSMNQDGLALFLATRKAVTIRSYDMNLQNWLAAVSPASEEYIRDSFLSGSGEGSSRPKHWAAAHKNFDFEGTASTQGAESIQNRLDGKERIRQASLPLAIDKMMEVEYESVSSHQRKYRNLLDAGQEFGPKLTACLQRFDLTTNPEHFTFVYNEALQEVSVTRRYGHDRQPHIISYCAPHNCSHERRKGFGTGDASEDSEDFLLGREKVEKIFECCTRRASAIFARAQQCQLSNCPVRVRVHRGEKNRPATEKGQTRHGRQQLSPNGKHDACVL